MSYGVLRRVALVRTDVSEKIPPPSSWFLIVIGLQICGVRIRATPYNTLEHM
jgi:hypothetical protein